MELKKIDANKLIFSGLPMDDRTNTYLSLEDYDWMTYVLQTQFKTEKMGILRVKFEFLGVTSSTMTVEQTYKGIVQEYQYEFLSDIFQKYIVRYLKNKLIVGKLKRFSMEKMRSLNFIMKLLKSMKL